MNILIRTSGGIAPKKEIGLGHIYRTANLASYLKNNEIHFMIKDYGSVKKILNEMNFFQISELKKNLTIKHEILKMKEYIIENKIDLVIFDIFRIDLKLLNEIRKLVKIVVISDLQKYNYKANLVVNGFIGFKNTIKINSLGTKCLLGPNFQILNNKFCNKNKSMVKKNDLLVSFGGYDEKNIIEEFLKSSEKFIDKLKIKIILGPATKNNKKIKKYEKRFSNNLKIIQQTRDMSKELSRTKYGLCSGGITSYEFASKLIPFGIICQVNHQVITAKNFENQGFAINLGLKNNNTRKKIEEFLENIHKIKNNQKKQMIDGCGAKRVAQQIMKIQSKNIK